MAKLIDAIETADEFDARAIKRYDERVARGTDAPGYSAAFRLGMLQEAYNSLRQRYLNAIWELDRLRDETDQDN